VQCQICAHYCLIGPGKTGLCGVRKNEKGTLYSLVYGKAIALHVDPIEKKPLFHFFPGTRSLSIATAGCNMRCEHCQNANISQMPRETGHIPGEEILPETIVAEAVKQKCHSISYTYTEPAVFFDYAYDTAVLAHESGIKNVFVTNGYQSKESLDAIAPYLDAANVDLKTFQDETYRSLCGARLDPVLKTITRMAERNIWLEITTLLIPGINDSDAEMKAIASFIHDLNPGIPWHVSRFHPAYKMVNTPATSLELMRTAYQIGKDTGLRSVYIGNMPGEQGENTLCHNCGAKLIIRWGFQVTGNRLVGSKCPECRVAINGQW